MSGLFGGGGSAPQPATPIPPAAAPTIDMAKQKTYAQDAANMARGRAANILTSDMGDLTKTQTATKQLLGG
jgi:hypothetical protein